MTASRSSRSTFRRTLQSSIAPLFGVGTQPECLLIQVTLNEGRTTELKKAFFRAVADGLHQRLGLRKQDVFMSLVEVKKENWSFGNGEAQYAWSLSPVACAQLPFASSTRTATSSVSPPPPTKIVPDVGVAST